MDSNEKRNRRKKREEYLRRKKIYRSEFDPKARDRRIRIGKEKAKEFLDRIKQASEISVDKPTLLDKVKKWKTRMMNSNESI